MPQALAVQDAMSELLAELSRHPGHQHGEALNADEVMSFCSDACALLCCKRAELPPPLLRLYTDARMGRTHFKLSDFVDTVRAVGSTT